MAFPSTFSSFNRPSPSDRLNNPSHSALHNTVSSAVGQIEAVIGLDSSVLGTIIGDLRNPASGGGGHVQTAVLGGTGQTTFSKGTTLVASGPSTLSKLAVGLDGQTYVADSSVATGIKWGSPSASKISAIASVVTFRWNNGFSNASLISVTVPGSTLGTSNAIRLTSYARYIAAGGGTGSILIRTTFGGGIVNSVMLRSNGNSPTSSFMGKIEYLLVANNNVSAQRAILNVSLDAPKDNWATTSASVIGFSLYDTNTSSVLSSANQVIGISAMGGSGDEAVLTLDSTIIEKIV